MEKVVIRGLPFYNRPSRMSKNDDILTQNM